MVAIFNHDDKVIIVLARIVICVQCDIWYVGFLCFSHFKIVKCWNSCLTVQ